MTNTTAFKPRPRERLIRAASDLFVREGVHAVGVDHLSRTAEVSKRSMYQYFDNKYAVLEAALEVVGPQVLALYLPPEENASGPAEEMLAVFDALQSLSRSDAFVGCPFVNIAAELRDAEQPSFQQARRFKAELTDFFERQARRYGALDPEALAAQLTMVFDGACAYSVVRKEPLPDSTRAAAEALILASR
jgi:AcrR family transcriptional regulator